jgi:hypothetical protein
MRVLRPATEDEVVAAFLRAEIGSGRFRGNVLAALAAAGADESLVLSPQLDDLVEAGLRARALAAYRGWPNRYPFTGFPSPVAWRRVVYPRSELAQIRFPSLPEWRRRSPTRLPEPAAAGFRSSALNEPDKRQACRLLAERYRLQSEVPPIIVVSTALDGAMVVLEGCLRLTAMFWEAGPDEAEAFLGISPEMGTWPLYDVPASSSETPR